MAKKMESVHKLQSLLNLSKLAMQQQWLCYTCSLHLRRQCLPTSSARLPACKTYWKKQQRIPCARHIAGDVRFHCNSPL